MQPRVFEYAPAYFCDVPSPCLLHRSASALNTIIDEYRGAFSIYYLGTEDAIKSIMSKTYHVVQRGVRFVVGRTCIINRCYSTGCLHVAYVAIHFLYVLMDFHFRFFSVIYIYFFVLA